MVPRDLSCVCLCLMKIYFRFNFDIKIYTYMYIKEWHTRHMQRYYGIEDGRFNGYPRT